MLKERVNLTHGKITEVNFDFPNADASLSGIVTVSGKPLPVGSISYALKTTVGTETNTIQIDPDGSYTFEHLPAGNGVLIISAGTDQLNQRSVARSITIETGNEYTMDFDISGGHTLKGAIMGLRPDENRVRIFVVEGPITGDLIEVLRDPFRMRGRSDVTAEGEYSLEGMEAGSYTLCINITSLDQRNAVTDLRREFVEIEIPEGNGEIVLNISV